MGVLLFYIAGLFLFLMVSFGILDFMEWRESKKTKREEEYRRSMLWAPKVKKS